MEFMGNRRNLIYLFFSVFFVSAIILALSPDVFATSCWSYTTSALCTANSYCEWRNDSWSTSGWCQDRNCWNIYSKNDCTVSAIPGKNCTWQGGGTTYTCEKLQCWSLSGTNESACVNNSLKLSCGWSNYCLTSTSIPGVNCWSNQNQSACLNSTGCSWGSCNEQGCWNYGDSASCVVARDWNGINCTWNTASSYCEQNGCWKYTNQSACNAVSGINCVWKWDSCQQRDCYNWDYTNESACVNNSYNMSCTWGGTWCSKKDCWSYNNQQKCSEQPGCLWKGYTAAGWCTEIDCSLFSSSNGGTSSTCTSNGYGLSCTWDHNPLGNSTDGWCYKNVATMSCANKTNERDCMDTFYCWWRYTDFNDVSIGGTCNDPGGFSGITVNTSIFDEWNPGCYIFDMNSTNCNKTLGCNYSAFEGVCRTLDNNYGTWINANGLNCSLLNDSSLCTNMPALSACCAWQNGTCVQNKMSASCRDQVQQKTEDSCEDAETMTRCRQISDTPWYMPCIWNNATSKCDFKASNIFGNSSQSLVLIDNKMNCEAAGGKWIVENYCEGNASVPVGRCENKFDGEDNCDKACFACELKNSDGTLVNVTNAEGACKGSKLGRCEFTASTTAPNGIGYCKAKSQFKSGFAGDCGVNCGDCTFKGDPISNDTTKRPSYYCRDSKANSAGGGCKWIDDNATTTKGYCIKKSDKTCEDSCDRCKTQSDCSNKGRTSVANQTGSCKWQGDTSTGSCVNNVGDDVEVCWDGIDNDDNNLVDCSDAACYTDSYCGLVEGDCFGWSDSATCAAKSCEWVSDNWGSWCDFKGSRCWKYDSNESFCTGVITMRNETMDISGARKIYNNINESYNLTVSHAIAGLVSGSVVVINDTGIIIDSGNYTVDHTAGIIRFSNTTFMVSEGGMNNATKVTYQYYESALQKNCKWNNGTGSSWCERDMTKNQICMGYNKTQCDSASSSGCNWTVDSWCSGSGNTTEWCRTSGGWCDHTDFAPKNCWLYTSGDTECSSHSGCSWTSDQYMMPHCEVNWSSNCWQYTTNATCEGISSCWWRNDSWGGWCANVMDKCYTSYDSSTCNALTVGGVNICYWESWGGSYSGGYCTSLCYNSSKSNSTSCNAVTGCGWKGQSGWCGESSPCSNSTSSSNRTNCLDTQDCRWKQAGWCDPKDGGFSSASSGGGGGMGGAVGGECYKYDGNYTVCTNKSIVNISCGWTPSMSPKCEVNWGSNCWQYTEPSNGCSDANGCWYRNDSISSYCMSIMDQCWSNSSYQSWSDSNWVTHCRANPYCTNTSFNTCEPKCSSMNSSACNSITGCKYVTGWCNPIGMNEMFENMESGAPVPIGVDVCDEGIQMSVDLCGFGMKDMGDSFGFGGGVRDFSNASVCNKETLSSFVMGMVGGATGGASFGSEKTGSGNETVIFIIYLDTDGSIVGGCDLDSNSSAVGYEFRFKYTAQWNSNTSKVAETFNSDKCDSSAWKASDIQISAWKKKMCSDIGGPMIAIKKSELTRFPTLYDSTKDMRIFVATIGNSGNVSVPTDSIGPAWITPGAIDFEIKNAFAYGADTSKFEDILKKGYVMGEDCFLTGDEDGDGAENCADWDCQFASACSSHDYSNDTSTPQVIGIKIEEYTNATLIMYDTNKPTNGTLELYAYGDTKCMNRSGVIYDIGVLSANVRDFKMWHTAEIYDDGNDNAAISIDWPLVSGSTYSYKLKVCDSGGKCAISKCSNITVAASDQKCGYCSFVTRIKAPTGWTVSYDVDRDGIYEHVQGQVCGPNSGMNTNYTQGRRVNIKLAKTDNTTYIEFLNASLTKSGLNDKVRTISTAGSIIYDSTKSIVGLSSETRDKIVNNLHPEVCRMKILSSGVCNTLYHCDDDGNNCINRTEAAGGAPINANDCLWNIPYCEFSTYKTTSSSSSTGSAGGGGGAGVGISGQELPVNTYTINEEQFASGYVKELSAGEQIRIDIGEVSHYVKVVQFTENAATITVSSKVQQFVLSIGEQKNVDFDDDGIADLKITVESIDMINNKVKITVQRISEEIPAVVGEEEQAAGEEETVGAEELNTAMQKKIPYSWAAILIGAVVMLVAAVLWEISREKKRR